VTTATAGTCIGRSHARLDSLDVIDAIYNEAMWSPRTVQALFAAGVLGVAAAAHAQTAPPPEEAPPGYDQPPPGYQPPPPGYQPPPPGYQQQPPPGYQQPPPGYYPPPGYQLPPGYAPPPGYARTPAPPPPNLHDGFYLRMHIGGGTGHAGGTTSLGDKLELTSGTLSLGLALGGAVTPNLIIYGSFFIVGMPEPELDVNGTYASTQHGSTSFGGIGPGIAYYFDPYNIYVSGTIAATGFQTRDSTTNNFNRYESRAGFGFQGMVGKEWWVSENWGLGVAGEFLGAGGMKDKVDSGLTWSGYAFSVVFSATYN